MKLIQLFLCMFFIFTGCMADFESATERLYAAYKSKDSEEKERVFKKGQLEIGNKKEQLKPLIKFAMQVGDFEVLKQAIKDREKEKQPFIARYPQPVIAASCLGGILATSVVLLVFDKCVEMNW